MPQPPWYPAKTIAPTAKSFGKVLRERRLARGFGLREFAQLVGVSSTYISQLEQENIDLPEPLQTLLNPTYRLVTPSQRRR